MKDKFNNHNLSHIIFYVDKRRINEPLCAYCTNMSKNHPDTAVLLKSYDNQIDLENSICDELSDVYNSNSDVTDLFFITDSSFLCKYFSDGKIPFAALITEFNKNESFRHTLYCIEDIEEMDFEIIYRIWQRFNNIPWIICETKRTVIREQRLEDIDRLYEIYSEPSTTLYMEGLYADRDQELQYMRDYIANQYKFCEYGLWAIEDRSNGYLIGRAGPSQRAGYDELELGYVIDEKYRSKGYCTEVLDGIINYMKENYNIESLIAFVREDNEASKAVLRKLSFSFCKIEKIDGIEHLMYRRILT